MPRGMKKSHKGGRRQFTSAYNMAMEAEKNRRKQEWKSKKGLESDEDDETEGDGTEAEGSKKVVSSGSEEEEEEESGSDEDEEDDEPDKPKGISHLIETKNPNRVEQKPKTVTEGEAEENPTLSRRERTELSKQQSKKRYWKLHEAGKTDQARADLARLALIRKEREEASKKREEEKKSIAPPVQDGAKLVAEQKLLEKHKNV